MSTKSNDPCRDRAADTAELFTLVDKDLTGGTRKLAD